MISGLKSNAHDMRMAITGAGWTEIYDGNQRACSIGGSTNLLRVGRSSGDFAAGARGELTTRSQFRPLADLAGNVRVEGRRP